MLDTIMKEIENMSDEKTKKRYLNFGCKEPLLGLSAGKAKEIIKKYNLKNNQEMAEKLYDTKVYDARYLAGLIANSKEITKETIEKWTETVDSKMTADYTIGGVAAETDFGLSLAREYIKSDKELVASCGYSIYSFYVSLVKDSEIDKDELIDILNHIEKEIKNTSNLLKESMNNTIVAIGGSVPSLYDYAMEIGNRIGDIEIEDTKGKCKIVKVADALEKMKVQGRIGFKRKTSRC